MSECLIVGGGVIGLSLAYELAGHGMAVHVIDAGQPGQEASWAGAGILPPARGPADDPLDELVTLSNTLHAQWSHALRASTQIDNGYWRSGAVYLARDPREAPELARLAALAAARGIVARRLTRDELADVEPALRPSGDVAAAYLVSDECQIRNPRHLKALLVACADRGVRITPGAAAHDFERHGRRVRAVCTSLGPIPADLVCITAGSWTQGLIQKLGVEVAIKPIRGQIVLVSSPRRIVSRIINEGNRYLVPRADGRILIGSTEEDVGFDRGTTTGAVSGLLRFALELVPELEAARVERFWAGLRPLTADGLPYLGAVSGLENAFVAAGHFRGGLQLSTGTAVVMSELIRGLPPQIDLAPFRLDRQGAGTQNAAKLPRARRQVPLH